MQCHSPVLGLRWGSSDSDVDGCPQLPDSENDPEAGALKTGAQLRNQTLGLHCAYLSHLLVAFVSLGKRERQPNVPSTDFRDYQH